MKPLAATLIALLLAAAARGDERSEAARLAPKYAAQTEVVAWDGSRVDLLSELYAIEVEWAAKWKESIGQAVYYSILFHREPGVVLLRRRDADEDRHIYRCQAVCARLGIKLWIEDAQE